MLGQFMGGTESYGYAPEGELLGSTLSVPPIN